jgi:hypothetical protein
MYIHVNELNDPPLLSASMPLSTSITVWPSTHHNIHSGVFIIKDIFLFKNYQTLSLIIIHSYSILNNNSVILEYSL